MASFEQFKPLIMQVEGGYQRNPSDTGNYNTANQLVGTNYGIAAKTLEHWYRRPITTADMKALTIQTAFQIYKKEYWDKMKADFIRSQKLAEILVDGAINHGPGTAARLMQQAINESDGRVSVDGAIGQQSLAAMNSLPTPLLYNNYRQKRINRYHQIVQQSPSQATFLNGWMSRMKQFPTMQKQLNIPTPIGEIPLKQSTTLSLIIIASIAIIYFLTQHQKTQQYA